MLGIPGTACLTARSISKSARPTAAGTIDTYRVIVSPTGERVERPYVLHVYSAKEWVEMLHEAGFAEADVFGAWDGVTPISPDAWRLVIRSR